jgi:CRP/FNR family cyclic AMP-dependent transcriptional regulator
MTVLLEKNSLPGPPLPELARRRRSDAGRQAQPLRKLDHARGVFFDPVKYLERAGVGKTRLELKKDESLFTQGQPANAIFYIKEGRVRLSVVAKTGKEATLALLGRGDFIGEECVGTDHPLRLASAAAISDCLVVRIDKSELVRILHEQHDFSDMFVAFLVARTVRMQEDLVDQLFNSSEKRLARTLLLLAHFGKDGTPETVIPKISQETLAEMVGTTRSRVSFFMNRFRKLGFIKYNGTLEIHSSLLNVILHD